MSEAKFVVVVREVGTDVVVRRIECANERAAEKVERGVLRQMDRRRFTVGTEPVSE